MGSGGNLDAGDGTLTGTEPGQACIITANLCEWRPITASNDAATLSSACMSQEGQVATDCPAKDLSGCCADGNGMACHYNVTNLQVDIQQCESLDGSWRSVAP